MEIRGGAREGGGEGEEGEERGGEDGKAYLTTVERKERGLEAGMGGRTFNHGINPAVRLPVDSWLSAPP